ncbi:MAG: 50S ribosomal protein L23 [Actinomycetaceae bacterium]|nr:50S ribosomal protein L23 [Actinomycetaceae bacterium]
MSLHTEKNPRDVIIRPIVSEKAYGMIDTGKYTFEVARDANKIEIRHAIERIFDVKVAKVNTLNRVGKRVRTRTGYGKRKDIKLAIVTLAEGSIEIFAEAGV